MLRRTGRLFRALGVLLALSGCAHQTTRAPPPKGEGNASWHALEAADTRHYQLALGEVSSGGEVIDRQAPVYPPSWLDACPAPVDVQAKLIVDGAGKVSEARVLDPGHDPSRRLFIDAVGVATLRWIFQPLQFTQTAANANGDSHTVRPFSLDYVFQFTCRAGKAEVSSAAGSAP